jgi:hypothetical protein
MTDRGARRQLRLRNEKAAGQILGKDQGEDDRTGDCEANCRISRPITKEQVLNTVEGSTPSEAEKETETSRSR